MNQVVEKFCNFYVARCYCQDMENLTSYVSSKYGVNGMAAKYFVILGCLSLLIYVLMRRPSVQAQPNNCRSLILREIHSGNILLSRLMEDDYKIALANPATLNNAENLLKHLLNEELLDFLKLQQTVSKLEMSSKENSAMKILEDAVKKAHDAGKPHETYEIQMLLVEVYIYKGNDSKLEKSLKFNCLVDNLPTDARRPLYKAIIHTMLGKTEEARTFWEEFLTVREPFHYAIHYHSEPHFDTFKDRVQRLQTAKTNSFYPEKKKR